MDDDVADGATGTAASTLEPWVGSVENAAAGGDDSGGGRGRGGDRAAALAATDGEGDRIARADFDFRYIESRPTRWTFSTTAVRRYVESRLEGRVLNLFAGRTRLRHDGEIVRNDLDEDIAADHHFDAAEVADRFPPRSFDTVILDPPYSVRKSREKYNGRYRGRFTRIKDLLVPVVKLGGRVLHFGYASTGMSSSRGFRKCEVCLINHKGDFNDTICTVERRVVGGLQSYGVDEGERESGDGDDRGSAAEATADAATGRDGAVASTEAASALADGGDRGARPDGESGPREASDGS